MKPWLLAARTLMRRPGFAAAAILILGLGIGANSAMFSMIDAVLLKPLPYPDPDRLVTVYEASTAKNQKTSLIAPGRLEDWARLNHSFTAIAGSYSESVTDTSSADPERLDGRRVSPRYFETYAMKPLLGRTFSPTEEVFGGPQVAVISEAFWQRRFHTDPNVTQQRLLVVGKPLAIIGVMPRHFSVSPVDVWLPAQTPPFLLGIRDARFYGGVGRLKPGVTPAQAQADLSRVQHQLGEQYPKTDKDWSALVEDLKEQRVGSYRKPLVFVFGAVALLLLIAVANIAGLMLSQLDRRSRELAIRSSIGATRVQVIGSILREVLLLSAAGVAVGATVGTWLVNVLSRSFETIPRSGDFSIDWRALLFASFAGVIAAVMCGLLPAMQATRSDVAALLAQNGRGESGGRHRWQAILVAGQVALTVLLLTSAGLMLQTYRNLSHVDPGFDASHSITFHVGAAWNEDRTRNGQMQTDLLSKLESYPGVVAAGFVNFLPATGATLRYQLSLEGMSTGNGSAITVGERGISGNYLKAMGAPIVAGSDCPSLPAAAKGQQKALVSRRFADMYSNGQNLVGMHFRWLQSDLERVSSFEIVGVAGTMQEDSLSVTPAPYAYVCLGPGNWPDPEYVVRTRGDSRALVQALRSIVHSVDPTRAVFGVKTVDEVLSETLEQPRMNTRLLTLFSAAALFLAALGLYSLMSMFVTSRRREIGVRMTLGAKPGRIVLQMLAGVGRLLAAGMCAGIILTFFGNRLLRSMLFGVQPMDPRTLIATVFVLAVVASAAVFVPVLRAARIDPLEAIRTE